MRVWRTSGRCTTKDGFIGEQIFLTPFITSDRQQSKMLMLSTNADGKYKQSFSFAICRLPCDKWQSKTLFLMIFDLRLIGAYFSVSMLGNFAYIL